MMIDCETLDLYDTCSYDDMDNDISCTISKDGPISYEVDIQTFLYNIHMRITTDTAFELSLYDVHTDNESDDDDNAITYKLTRVTDEIQDRVLCEFCNAIAEQLIAHANEKARTA